MKKLVNVHPRDFELRISSIFRNYSRHSFDIKQIFCKLRLGIQDDYDIEEEKENKI